MISVPDAGLAGARGNLCGGSATSSTGACPGGRMRCPGWPMRCCADGPVRSLVELLLAGEHRRGHGSLYAALSRGRCYTGRLRKALASTPLPRAADGRLVLGAAEGYGLAAA